MYKAIVVSLLSLSILLFGGVGQLAARTFLVGNCPSTAEAFIGSGSETSGAAHSDQSEFNGCPSVHAGSGAFLLDIPVLETEDEKLNAPKKQLEQQGRWDGIVRTFGMHSSVFQQSIEQGRSVQHHLRLLALGVLYLLFGVLRV